jgi:transcriptional regulator with XRE-family HTH domain
VNRLDKFMQENRLTNVRLATRAGIDSQRLSAFRRDKADPPLPIMRGLAAAVSVILRRKVRVTELFDLGDGER